MSTRERTLRGWTADRRKRGASSAPIAIIDSRADTIVAEVPVENDLDAAAADAKLIAAAPALAAAALELCQTLDSLPRDERGVATAALLASAWANALAALEDAGLSCVATGNR